MTQICRKTDIISRDREKGKSEVSNLGNLHGNLILKTIHIDKKEDARTVPTPITTYALLYDGKYLTNEQMNDTKFLKFAGH